MTVERVNLSSAPAPVDGVPQSPPAVTAALRILADVVKNEETRFSNLNTRAVAVVSSTSLATTLAGVFSKDLMGEAFTGWGRTVGGIGIILTVLFLAVTAAVIISRVLAPSPRLLFGGNPLTDNPATVDSPEAVDRVAFADYLAIYRSLRLRNKEKAEALNLAYWCLLAAVVIVAATTILVIVSRLPSPNTTTNALFSGVVVCA